MCNRIKLQKDKAIIIVIDKDELLYVNIFLYY